MSFSNHFFFLCLFHIFLFLYLFFLQFARSRLVQTGHTTQIPCPSCACLKRNRENKLEDDYFSPLTLKSLKLRLGHIGQASTKAFQTATRHFLEMN